MTEKTDLAPRDTCDEVEKAEYFETRSRSLIAEIPREFQVDGGPVVANFVGCDRDAACANHWRVHGRPAYGAQLYVCLRCHRDVMRVIVGRDE
jgi:hypothetical protein